MVDLTREVTSLLTSSSFHEGFLILFVPGSTAALTTIEYEDGLVQDFSSMMEKIAPRGDRYAHHMRWGDDNGHAHLRASLLGPSLTVPFARGKLALGTWQQIVFIDFDTRPRKREIVVQITGNRLPARLPAEPSGHQQIGRGGSQ